MKIKKVKLFHIKLPLKFTFITAKTSMISRETLIVRLTDEKGEKGYGECVAFKNSSYTDETLEKSKQVLQSNYLPLVLKKEIAHPFDIHLVLDGRFPMAIAAVENALLDLYGKRQNRNIVDLIFQEKKNSSIQMGMVLGDISYDEMIEQIKQYKDLGCRRFKLKISPKSEYKKVEKILDKFRELSFLVDANKSFHLSQVEDIRRYDKLDLLCIEEPFYFSTMEECQGIQKMFTTPICLDESVQSMADLKRAHALNIFTMINIKVGRLGGLFHVKEAINFCRQEGLGFWIGSMVESGISKVLHTQLAGLSDVSMPGDLSDSLRYFEDDLIHPTISFDKGKFQIPNNPGLGVSVNEESLLAYALDSWIKEIN